jgi:predicted metalloprotease
MHSSVWGRVRALVALIVVFVAIVPSAATVAQTDDPRVEDVSRAALELSQLERDGDLLMMHDLLHPDVRLVLSRAELAQWYAGPDAAIPTADPEILSVEFGSWMWPVTGRTYADVATVTLRQPATLGGEARDLVEIQHYWFDGARWRWFFGSDAGYLDALQAQVPVEPEIGMYEDIEYARVNDIWTYIYEEAGASYRPPDAVNTFSYLDLPMQTGCGGMTEEDYSEAFYCPLDQEIYFETAFRDIVRRQFGDYAWRFAISHEWGHHIQFLEGIDTTENPELDDGFYQIEIELQADCIAGVYAQEAVARGWATVEELNDAYQVALFIGDLPDTTFDDPLAHGNGEQRQLAFTTGLEDGVFGCNLQLDSGN